MVPARSVTLLVLVGALLSISLLGWLPVAAVASNSLSLNGSGAYMNVPNSSSLNITGSITVEAWIKTNSTAQQGIVERYGGSSPGGYALRLSGGYLQFFTLVNGTSQYDYVQSTLTVSTGAWHHVAGVFDGSHLSVYIDGTQRGSKSSTFAPGTGTNSVKIGARGDDGHATFNGLIDEVRITANAVYSANFVPSGDLTAISGTRGLWKFDGQTTADSSGNSNDGSLVGSATYSTDAPNKPPTVSLSAPTGGATFTAPASITVTASAADSDGTVSRVDFYQGTTSIGSATSGPFTITWSNVAAGNYSLTAKATDDLGAVTTSASVSITVNATGSITGKVTRLDGTTAIAGASVSVLQGTSVAGTATTNSSGDYSVGTLSAGTYSVAVSASGYESKTQTGVSVTSGSATTVNISLAVPITYLYDDMGRLISVIDKDGNAATYSYDAVGNLLSISRQVPSTVSIIQFTPSGGAVGSIVTIYGSGYSATASQNSVTFNGVSATLSASSTSLIVTTVPTGATTGPIVVTTPAGSATSSTSFTVGANSLGAPTIISFSPTVGAAGTSVSITGTNFNSTSSNDKAAVNVSQATIGSASSTSISTTIPSATASGRISVATATGKAVSSADFIVPPPTFTASDIEYTGRMSVGGTSTLTISTANKIGLMLFDGTANQRVALSYSNNTIAIGAMTIISPTGFELFAPGSGYFFSSGFVEPLRLPMTGTYTIMVDPENTNTGSMPITLYDVPADLSGSITIGGSPVSIATAIAGQNASLSFSANAGQKVSLSMASSTIGLADIYIKDSWGANIGSRLISTGADFMDTVTLPSTGSYTVKVDPRTVLTGGVTLTLNNANDVTGTITPSGSSAGVTINVPGQSGVLTFSGTSGHRVSLAGSSCTFGEYSIGIYKPDGSVLTSNSGFLGSSPFFDPQTLPSTGAYSIVVNPQWTNTGSISLTLYDVPADVSGSISIGGSAVSVTITVPGQNGQLTFSGASGQQVTVHITGSTLGNFPVSLLKPDGTVLTSSNSFWNSNFDLTTQTLPSTGTYTIRIDPSGATTGTLNVTVTSP
jgi:YD repeat-containing protein